MIDNKVQIRTYAYIPIYLRLCKFIYAALENSINNLFEGMTGVSLKVILFQKTLLNNYIDDLIVSSNV